MVNRRARKPLNDPRTWHEVYELRDFKAGDLVGVTGTVDSTWTFMHAAVSNINGDVVWVTVYGGTGGPDGNQQFRSFLPDRIRELTAAEAKKRANKATAEAKKAAKAAEKPAELRKSRKKRA